MEGSPIQARRVRVVRESTYSGRVLRVLHVAASVQEAEDFLRGYGTRTGCTMYPWGEPRTRNVVRID